MVGGVSIRSTNFEFSEAETHRKRGGENRANFTEGLHGAFSENTKRIDDYEEYWREK